jgi:AcrR family transcriptional regulator
MIDNSDTEKKILTAASKIFLDKGKDGARMQEIADQAGINKALLHYYFRSKERLFQEVFKNEVMTLLNNILDAISETEDFRDFLTQFVRAYLQNITPRRALMRFVFWEVDKTKENLARYFWQTFSDHGFTDNPLVLRVNRAVAEKQIRPVDPVHFVLSMLGVCVFPFMAAPIIGNILRKEIDVSDPDFQATREQEIVTLLWNGLKPL